ncbi:hypothetical protein ACQSED_19430 [Salmonella enterica]|uniref:hypothetical protein n=1 Tax=Salmonella enterica TaxID=28901 RepID=UPI003D312763
MNVKVELRLINIIYRSNDDDISITYDSTDYVSISITYDSVNDTGYAGIIITYVSGAGYVSATERNTQ